MGSAVCAAHRTAATPEGPKQNKGKYKHAGIRRGWQLRMEMLSVQNGSRDSIHKAGEFCEQTA